MNRGHSKAAVTAKIKNTPVADLFAIPRGEADSLTTLYSYLAPTDTAAGREWTEWFVKVRRDLATPGPDGRTKTFRYRWRRGPGYTWVPAKRPRSDELLYNLRELLDAIEAGEDIWWCEGEKDADALVALGIVATSHHGGAGKVTREQAQWFAGHRGLVVLAYDLDPDDEHGGNPGAFDVILRYTLLREVGIVRDHIAVVHSRKGKDIADHLAAGYAPSEVVSLRSLAELRVKAARTSAETFRRCGYLVPDWASNFTVIDATKKGAKTT